MTNPIDDLFEQLSTATALTAAHQKITDLEAEVERLTDENEKLTKKLRKSRQTIRRMEEGEL